jgi:predicted O-linked N-acetylglucosamine transferase (SPINDLY family)
MKDISDEFQQNYGRVCRGGMDVFESAESVETAQRINAMQLLVLLWINGWTSEATAALLIPRPSPVQIAWLGNPSVAATKLVDFLVSGECVM